jgi:hypothetical protein
MIGKTIPVLDGCDGQLHYVEALDNRTAEDILNSLDKFQPVVSEKNIWAFWHSGLRSMPPWCQRNIVNWLRLNGNEWTVRVLDNVKKSPNNVLQYVPKNTLPPAYLNNHMVGPFVGQHSADLVRGACIYIHGGIWLDVGIILFRKLDRICWEQLADPSSSFEVSVMHMGGTGISNHFIAARRGSPFIKYWHELFTLLWKDRTSCQGLSRHPLLAPVLEAGRFHGDKDTNHFGWEHKCTPDQIMDYGAHILAWQRLALTENVGDGFSGTKYFATKILFLNVLEEAWRAETLVGWRGSDLFEVLNTKLDAPAESQKFQLALNAIRSILAQSSMQKVYRGSELLKYPALGSIWDEKENGNKDCEPGTFAELLRYGSVHFEQTRDIRYTRNPQPTVTFMKGLFEV